MTEIISIKAVKYCSTWWSWTEDKERGITSFRYDASYQNNSILSHSSFVYFHPYIQAEQRQDIRQDSDRYGLCKNTFTSFSSNLLRSCCHWKWATQRHLWVGAVQWNFLRHIEGEICIPGNQHRLGDSGVWIRLLLGHRSSNQQAGQWKIVLGVEIRDRPLIFYVDVPPLSEDNVVLAARRSVLSLFKTETYEDSIRLCSWFKY